MEMGLIPPTDEPAYGFPIVRCPQCGMVAVRSFADTDAQFRRGRRLLGAAWYAGCNGVASFVMMLALLGLVAGFSDQLVAYGLSVKDLMLGLARGEHRVLDTDIYSWYNDRGQFWLVSMVCVGVLAGSGWAFLWPHWKRWTVVVVSVIIAHSLLFMPIALNWIETQMASVGTVPGTPPPVLTASNWSEAEMVRAFPLLWIALLIGVAGWPLGRIVRRLRDRFLRKVLQLYKSRLQSLRVRT